MTLNPTILTFVGIVVLTLAITAWASLRTHTRSEFYTAAGRITALQNGWAIAGDFLSASTFLGITALYFSSGVDAALLLVGSLMGWPILLCLFGERLRNLGRYTFADVCSVRLSERPIRLLAASGSLIVVLLYLVAQVVGAGSLIAIIFGTSFEKAVVFIGALVIVYVTFGGMLATTWVQIIKAVLLVCGLSALAWLTLSRFGFDLSHLISASVAQHPRGAAILSPGLAIASSLGMVSVVLSTAFGPAGLPHVLMRFFTVPDARAARRSVFYASLVICYAFILVTILGLGAVALLYGDVRFFSAEGTMIGGANMAIVHLSNFLGGPYLLGFVAAVAFATILAVVAGLSLAGAATMSHDIYGQLLKRGSVTEREEVTVSRIAVVVIGVVAIGLAILFQKENLAFLAVAAQSIAASVNFPLLLLCTTWRNLTTRGAVWGGAVGVTCALGLLIAGPNVWVDVLHHARPLFPLQYPTIVALPVTLATTMLVSLLDRTARAREDRAAFDVQLLKAEGVSLAQLRDAARVAPATRPASA